MPQQRSMVPEVPYAMSIGHSPFQLGVWGAVSPPVGPGQSPVGGKGAKSPESLENTVLCWRKNCQKPTVFIYFSCEPHTKSWNNLSSMSGSTVIKTDKNSFVNLSFH